MKMPPDGATVTAMTYENIEYDREPEEVTGTLTTKPSPFGPPPKCYVDGRVVDPSTVRATQGGGSKGDIPLPPSQDAQNPLEEDASDDDVVPLD